MTKFLYPIPFAPFLLLLPQPIAAAPLTEESGPVASVRVPVDDLDLQTAAGWRTAKSRVKSAAARVCAAQGEIIATLRCRQESEARAERRLAQQSRADDDRISTSASEPRSDRSRSVRSGQAS